MLHVSVPPPPLVIVIGCAAGLLPAFVEYVRLVVLTCMVGGATVTFIATVVGLPLTAAPVTASVAVSVTLIV
jgi:hypothetical protein